MNPGRVCHRSACLLAGLALLAGTALAGPPLICHPIDTGGAASLPWAGQEWRAVDKTYDLNRLVSDTLSLLAPRTPVLARMETIRRATVYAVWAKVDHKVGLPVRDAAIAEQLLVKLMARAQESPDALFDAGYLMAAYHQAGYQSSATPVRESVAYEMVRKAAAATGSPEMEFAAALITRSIPDAGYQQHVSRARAGARTNSLLARNLSDQLGAPQ